MNEKHNEPKQRRGKMTHELEGVVKLVGDPQVFASGFTKREMVLTVEDGKYPQEISIEFLQNNAGLLDDIPAGDEIKVFFNIKGREYNGRYFNNLVGWKVERVSSARSEGETPPKAGKESPNSADDDLPF